MQFSLTSGLKILAGISVVISVFMLLGTSWIFGTQMVTLDTKIDEYHLPKFNSTRPARTTEEKKFEHSVKDLKHVWAQNQPILTTCSSIAIVAGLTQLVASFFVVFSDPKKIRHRAKYWLTIHFMIFVTLIVCLLTVYLIKTNRGLSMKYWFTIVEEFENSLKELNPQYQNKPVDYSQLLNYIKCGQPLYYAATIPDLVASITLVLCAVFVMHRYGDYETCE